MDNLIKLKTSMSYYGLMYARIEEMLENPWELGCKGIILENRLGAALDAIRNGTFTKANPKRVYLTSDLLYMTDILKCSEASILQTWTYSEGVPKQEIMNLCGQGNSNGAVSIRNISLDDLPQPDEKYEGAVGLFESSAKAPKSIPIVDLKIKKVGGVIEVNAISDNEEPQEEYLSPKEKQLANYIINELKKIIEGSL